MVSFTTGVTAGLLVGGTIAGSKLWNKPVRGLFWGAAHATATLGIKHIFGRNVSAGYLAVLMIFTVNYIIKHGKGAAKTFENFLSSYIKDSKTEIPSSPEISKNTVIWTNKMRSQVGIDTIEAIKKGWHVKDYKRVELDVKSGEALFTASKLYLPSQQFENIAIGQAKITQIDVANKDCLVAAYDELKTAPDNKVAVLCFGSPTEPGGGFYEEGKISKFTGTNGLEEQICYRSDLGAFMVHQFENMGNEEKGFYFLADVVDLSKRIFKRPYKIIHTPDVTVFRNSQEHNYGFLDKPFKVGILTSAAVVEPKLDPTNSDYANSDDSKIMKELIMTQLYAAYKEGYRTLILGAFGCGAFRNPPKAVAQLYYDALHKEFKGVFEKVVFAILENSETPNSTGNFKPFYERFMS